MPPFGTANDLAWLLEIPSDLREGAWIAAGEHSRAVDLGRANRQAFRFEVDPGELRVLTPESASAD